MGKSLLAERIFKSYLNQSSTNRKIWCARVNFLFLQKLSMRISVKTIACGKSYIEYYKQPSYMYVLKGFGGRN